MAKIIMNRNGKDLGNLEKLISSSFPELRFTTIEWNENGWDNLVAIADRKVVFRFPRGEEMEEQLLREIKLLPLLANCPVSIPDYRYVSTENGLVAGYPYLAGEPLNSAGVIGVNLLSDMTMILKWLSSVDTETLSETGLRTYTAESWPKRQERVLKGFQESLSEYMEDRVLEMIREEMTSVLEGIPEESIYLVHGDLYSENVLISRGHDRITGILDWGDSFVGDSALDIAALGVDFGREATLDLVASLARDTDPGLAERAFFYQKIEPLYLADNLARRGYGQESLRACRSFTESIRK